MENNNTNVDQKKRIKFISAQKTKRPKKLNNLEQYLYYIHLNCYQTY